MIRRRLVMAFAVGLVWSLAPDARAQDYTKTPVMMVHGSGLTTGSFTEMIAAFLSGGYPPEYLFAIPLVPQDGANGCAATDQIAPAVETLLAAAGAAATAAGQPENAPTKIDFVAHSMGALSSRWYTAKLRPDRVRTWVALAGANHGTNALCGFSGDGNVEMCPAFATSTAESELQVLINGTPAAPLDTSPFGLGADPEGVAQVPPDTARSILYYTVRIDPDVFIKPEASGTLAGAGGATLTLTPSLPVTQTSTGNFLFTGATTHDELPQHPDAIQVVSEMLAVRDGL